MIYDTGEVMGRTFGYGRVSTLEQSTDNQLLALRQRGFEIQENRWFSDKISGGVPALQRAMSSVEWLTEWRMGMS
ncbi:recombinase family protein [Pseudomonas aeruginosa]|nr:recombinase family protein [Pseudomonas aeruginosa]